MREDERGTLRAIAGIREFQLLLGICADQKGNLLPLSGHAFLPELGFQAFRSACLLLKITLVEFTCLKA